jgi:hypothetical protein
MATIKPINFLGLACDIFYHDEIKKKTRGGNVKGERCGRNHTIDKEKMCYL